MSASAYDFDLSPRTVTSEEIAILKEDLQRLGLDERCCHALNGLLTTRSRSDTPLVLRAYRDRTLRGLAYLLECRRTGECLFPGRVGRVLDTVPVPMYCWTRGDAAVDLLSNPGFTAPGESRHDFYRDAIAFLNTKYVSGSVIEPREAQSASKCYETAFMDWGEYTVEPGGVEQLFAAHKNLRRKENKFRNKGGTVQAIDGALTPVDRDAVLTCIRQSAGLALVRAPYQENYENMVRWASESGTPGILHLLARMDGEVVGYHTFLRSGHRLQCLSGGFDRTRATTFHAYENILLESMRLAESQGLRSIAFGPVANPSKAALMPTFRQYVLRFYSRAPLVQQLLSVAIPRSALRAQKLAPCTGLTPKMPAHSEAAH